MKKKSDLKKLKKLLKKRNISFEQHNYNVGPVLEVGDITFFFTKNKKKLEDITY